MISEAPTQTNPIFQWINEVVRQVLNKWSGYQLAILNQTGGVKTREKDLW